MSKRKDMSGTARCSECGKAAEYDRFRTLVIRHEPSCSQYPRRKTSTYSFEVETPVPSEVADILVDNCIADVSASGILQDPKRAFVRFRAKDDEEARQIAMRLTDLSGVLKTGYGVNERVIPE